MNLIKVFLVEDEVVMREGIKNNIDWEKEGFLFVGEAADGELAIPMIEKCHPDILITDIRMPFMDGLELSRLIKKEMPDIKIIILSGYDEFEYAKEAISIGVTNYLLKPMTGEKLVEEIKQVAVSIEAERKQQDFLEAYKKEMEEGVLVKKRQLFRDIIDNKYSVPQLLERGKTLGINLAAQLYKIILFQAKPSDDSELVIGDEYSEKSVQISEKITEQFGDNDNLKMYEQLGGVIVFILMAADAEQMKNQENHCIESLTRIIGEFENVIYFIGVGTDVSRLRETWQSYNNANNAFAHRYVVRESRVFYYEKDTVNNPDSDSNQIDLENLDIGSFDRRIVLNFLRSGTAEEIEQFIENYFQSIGEKNINSYIFRQYVVMDLYFTTASFLDSLGLDKERVTAICGDFKGGTRSLDSTENARSYLSDLFTKAILQRNTIAESKYGTLLDYAKAYIVDNFDNEDISLNMVAASVNISPNHFSTIFSQKTGETFIEFLTRVRMDKAKELLRSTSLKSSEIGYSVGYKDPHYFSYIFKKTQNMTPKEFRTCGLQ